MDNDSEEALEPFNNLIETLEILRDAVVAHDKDKSFEAVTIVLMQYMDTFGHDVKLIGETFPYLEKLKNHIQSKHFDKAYVMVLAFLAKMREVREEMRLES